MTIKPVPGAASTLPYMLVLDFSAISMTDDEFVAFCCDNRDFRFEMTASRELIVMPPAHSDTAWKEGRLFLQVANWAEMDGTGLAFSASAGFTLPDGSMKAPGACWILRERWNALEPAEQARFAPICPDFVIELRSRTDSLVYVQEKMDEYIENGVRLGLLVDPAQQRVHVFRPGQPVAILDRPDTVSCEPELPAFTLDLRDIWRPVGG